jgi:hypothetical protein
MKILSIDVGIKNLAFCLFETNENGNYFIKKWDVINLTENENNNLNCCFIDKNKICNNTAKFKKFDKCYCLKHSKKQQFQIPTNDQSPNFISKQKISKLFDIANLHKLKYNNKIKKSELIELINSHFNNIYFDKIENKKAKEMMLITLGINLMNKFNIILKDEISIDFIIIENQIGPLAIRMKTLQGMIVQYFIMSNLDVKNIQFISAINKLKDLDDNKEELVDNKIIKKEKQKYSDRKKLAISKCLDILNLDFRFNNKLDYFNEHKKKDDLADSFLQGLWFIKNNSL